MTKHEIRFKNSFLEPSDLSNESRPKKTKWVKGFKEWSASNTEWYRIFMSIHEYRDIFFKIFPDVTNNGSLKLKLCCLAPHSKIRGRCPPELLQ